MPSRIRFVTAASLFDGHDVSINIMRRLLQSKGAEVIHLGHNRSAKEVVDAALQEDVHAIALSSYQGGHVEYFSYIRELLDKANAKNIKIFGGGGGVIVPKEIQLLHDRGITRLYSPEDGMKLGLEGIIDDMLSRVNFSTTDSTDFKIIQSNQEKNKSLNFYDLAKVITYIEDRGELPFLVDQKLQEDVPVLGITGTGGAGKSSLIDELLLRFNLYLPDKKIALVSVDPTKKKGQGALLGDRIRLGSALNNHFFIRSLATRDSKNELSPHIEKVLTYLKSLDFDLIMVESSGIGQAQSKIEEIADQCVYVMTPEFGAQTQLEKIEMLEVADFVVINKFERSRSEDALRDVRKQFRRERKMFDQVKYPDEDLPVFGTMASQFNDEGVNSLFFGLVEKLRFNVDKLKHLSKGKFSKFKSSIIPVDRTLYLRNIANAVKKYNEQTDKMIKTIWDYECLENACILMSHANNDQKSIKVLMDDKKKEIPVSIFHELDEFQKLVESYTKGEFKYFVRDKEFNIKTKYQSISQCEISRVGFPKFISKAESYKFIREENLPGHFPFSSGIFPFKRKDEEPKRQFAGEGGPKRTNKRFHFLSEHETAKRLSTAFDSVTLYGEDPDKRPDIYGKIGESGVSICTLDDMIDLYKGFDLTSPNTSVSKTINGPAPIILAMFMNAAIHQKLKGEEIFDKKKRIEIMKQVRGTVQADILKEDQAQNTCIFSLDFALKMMGDIQEYFSKYKINNYYTVSISGYHIAEAGANPITQLAFTLANGFTYVEYYLNRGIPIDDFASNLSFFFSNGLDPEYSVLGRVARKIWAIAMRDLYNASEKSQKLKYHIQTSGRSLHAQEVNFNDIRTTLQAFLALSDNCNSLHTNAYDEAITTPTEESVRRAMAIQLIINREFGLNKTDNPLQGSYIINELSEIVEDYVLKEFERLSDKGGVLGAMESMYQRGKIQDESLYYETLKDNGELPIIGVNTYVSDNVIEMMKTEINLTRASYEEKDEQIKRLNNFKTKNKEQSKIYLEKLKNVVLKKENIFEELLETVNFCSLGEISNLLYEVGGKYRRNI